MTDITTVAELEALVGFPGAAAVAKVRPALHELDREWLAATAFCLVATADAEGRCDVSPKGDPPGELVHVIDDRTLALAERPGNRRVDGFRNVLVNPHVGLIFFLPGRGDTLRVNGRARLVTDGPFFGDLATHGHRPVLALVVEVEEVFHHCSKAFLRAKLWDPTSWRPEAVTPRPVIARTLERPSESLTELQQRYGPTYAEHLYG